MEIEKKKIQFLISQKCEKSDKNVQDLYTEICKIFLREIKEKLNKWRHILYASKDSKLLRYKFSPNLHIQYNFTQNLKSFFLYTLILKNPKIYVKILPEKAKTILKKFKVDS